jgi:hypothetical protein
MSWEIFKRNILNVANSPEGIPDIDTIADLYAKEYDAAIKRGGDSINNVSVKRGNVDTMRQLFKSALQKGLNSKAGYDLVGEMGQGVLAYWSGATLNEFPVPKIPATGATQNIGVISNIVTSPGSWQPVDARSQGTEADQEIEEGDDTPEVEQKEKTEHEERNDVVIPPDETVPSKSEQVDYTPNLVNEEDETLTFVEIKEDPGKFPPRQRFTPRTYRVTTNNNGSGGGGGGGNFEGEVKIYGNVGAQPYPGAPDFRKNYKNAYIPMEAMVGIQKGGKTRYTYKGEGGWYLLHPEAASQYFKMKEQAIADKISWTLSSAYRDYDHQVSLGTGSTVAKPGGSPHGWGAAIDFGELHALVGGSGNGAINKAAREKSSLYRWLSNNGPKYGWYNPYRLADGAGTDEIWHWEYWGHWVKYGEQPQAGGSDGFVTFNIEKDIPATIVFGGIAYATPSWMAEQMPQEFKSSKKIVIAPYTATLETIIAKYKGITIKSVSGFSAGGQQAWKHAGTIGFTGLIDPSTTADHVAKATNWSNVVMYYNNSNWGGKYAAVGDRLVEAAAKMGSSAVKTSLGHAQIPAKFFQLYGSVM